MTHVTILRNRNGKAIGVELTKANSHGLFHKNGLLSNVEVSSVTLDAQTFVMLMHMVEGAATLGMDTWDLGQDVVRKAFKGHGSEAKQLRDMLEVLTGHHHSTNVTYSDYATIGNELVSIYNEVK